MDQEPSERTGETRSEAVEFDNLKVAVRRQNTQELYIALQPPDAQPYIVAPMEAKPDQIVAFVQHWLPVIRELRQEMLKRFEKSKSLKCHYQTGDVAFLFGRPFMLRVNPIAANKSKAKAMRGRTNVQATIRPEVSVIDLFLRKTGDFDQGRVAFLALAKPIFSRNVISLVHQCMERVFPEASIPKNINIRPLRGEWIHLDQTKDTVWVSENLIPYPPECVVYVYLQQMIDIQAPNATEEERTQLLDKGLPNWRDLKHLLTDPNNVFSHQ